MELRHLRHFVALAEEHSFTHAAARELIVQSGLSSSVRALEAAAAASQAVPEVRGLLAGHLRIDTYPANPRVLPLPPWPAGPTRAHPALEITVRQTDGPAMTRMVTD
ncbi:hypothetical protein GCM10011583_73300 [Streptomyces camponoticapitis]|uniref:HTH lysR-type domain-containing protein n=1 Tax=Streptomyces camponoticapitis TaxID=1616125 RepID=A0ABQ2F0H1_9ACTN|nr:LysR family transcriptional regulator [Streptomyces camponoticapitis]GGK30773.1 hypothetical protein GCM10011583_73300 [Streptomyces camponoticapitis]